MFKNKGLLFVGREHGENLLIEKIANKLGWSIEKDDIIPGPTVIYDKEEDYKLAKKLWEVYRSKNLDLRKEFYELKI